MHPQTRLRGFRGTGYDIGRSVVWQAAWALADGMLVRQVWLPNRVRCTLLRLFGARIAEGVSIRHDVRIHWPWKLTVGRDSWIGVGAWILNLEPVTIGSDTCISQGSLLCTGSHDRHSPTFEFDNAPIVIGNRVWVAVRATVLRGVTIGDGAVIGATALVTRDVAEGAIVLAPASLVTNPS